LTTLHIALLNPVVTVDAIKMLVAADKSMINTTDVSGNRPSYYGYFNQQLPLDSLKHVIDLDPQSPTIKDEQNLSALHHQQVSEENRQYLFSVHPVAEAQFSTLAEKYLQSLKSNFPTTENEFFLALQTGFVEFVSSPEVLALSETLTSDLVDLIASSSTSRKSAKILAYLASE